MSEMKSSTTLEYRFCLNGIVKNFVDAWEQGQRPAIEDFLPEGVLERGPILIELVRADLEQRLKSGEAARVESYLTLYPELAEHRRELLELIAAEYRLRRTREPGLPIHGYLQRFAEFAEELKETLNRIQAGRDGKVRPADERPKVPGYEILDELGWGGMGVVYKARQLSLNRIVALKVIRIEQWTNLDTAVRRFRREAHLAAQLLHTHIVTVHDAGLAGETHFLVMEYVDGIDLARLIEESGPLGVIQSCEYIRQAALGLQHAHEQGLVHRDIKPANLIVSPPPENNKPTSSGNMPALGSKALPFRGAIVKILDMGLARLDKCKEEAETSESEDDTLSGHGSMVGTPDFMAPEQAANAHTSDIRADLYSLGCTFYYLLTGKVPFPGGTPADKHERHLTAEPTSIALLRPEVPLDILSIVRILMEKDPADRYQTPIELAEALRPFSWAGRMEADGQTFAPDTRKKPKSSGEIRIDGLIDAIKRREGTTRTTTPDTGEYRCFRGHADWVWSVAFSHDGRSVLTGSRDRTARLWDLRSGQELRCFDGHDDDVSSVSISGDGEHVLTGSADKTLRLWDASSGAELRGYRGHTDRVLSAVFLPTGQQARNSWNWLARVANIGVEFSSESQPLFSGSRDGTIRVWDLQSGVELRRLHGGTEFASVAFLGDGLSALTNGADNIVRLWAIENGRELCRFDGRENFFQGIALSPNGRGMLSAGEDATVRLWDVETGTERRRFKGHTNWVTSVAFSADGRLALSGSDDNTVRLWNVKTGEQLFSFTGHTDGITSVAFSPNGHLALSGSSDGTARCWKLPKDGMSHA